MCDNCCFGPRKHRNIQACVPGVYMTLHLPVCAAEGAHTVATSEAAGNIQACAPIGSKAEGAHVAAPSEAARDGVALQGSQEVPSFVVVARISA
eukprot:scaffold8649_cov23-Tisochrysis_lutea.AAC.1